MTTTRAEDKNDREIVMVEDTREELQDFLGKAQEIEKLKGEEQKKKIEEVFGKQKGKKQESELTETQKKENERRQTEIEERAESSRASSDVALAMQIADQVAADTAVENPCYVVHGAKLLCSMGSRDARLVVPIDHGVLLRNNPAMLAEDSLALSNIMCFGNCFSVENPNMEQAAIDATNQYNEKKSKTVWGKVKSFFGLGPKEADSASKELKAACICACQPSFPGGVMWEEGNEKSLIENKKTLIQSATLVCEYGGIIRIIDNGQDG